MRRLKQAIRDYLRKPVEPTVSYAPVKLGPDPNLVEENTAPITQDEFMRLFGSHMPMEAVELVFNSPDSKTIGEIRTEVRALANLHSRGELPSQRAQEQPRYLAQHEVAAYWRASPDERSLWNTYVRDELWHHGDESRPFKPTRSFTQWMTELRNHKAN